MRRVLLGTRNRDKLRELQSLMRGSGITVASLDDFHQAGDVSEDGRTFEANARKKARLYSRVADCLTFADDSGLMVDALNGRPGIYSARFAGRRCTYADNNRKLLALLSGKTGAKRCAKFVCVIALYYNGKPFEVVRGECRGRIADRATGRRGFGYDPVFIPKGFSRTFAEMPRAAKNRISHRARALRAAAGCIRRFFSRNANLSNHGRSR